MKVSEKEDQKKLEDQSILKTVQFLDIEKASNFTIDFSLFTSVEEIWISSKEPYAIPNSFLKLNQLKKLIIDANCILPKNIHQLNCLEKLWLNDNGVLNVPNQITQSKSIKTLNISFYDKVKEQPIPNWIYEMKQLKTLCFTVSKFTEINSKINQLEQLEELDFGCSFSLLQSFPSLSKLKKLKHLTISGKCVQGQKMPPYFLFSQVLEAIKDLHQLKYLNLSYWRPKRKQEWLVVKNKQHSIPDIFDRHPLLEELHLNDMNIDFIPQTVLELKHLKLLTIYNNKINHDEIKKIIKHLPNCQIESDIVTYKPKKK